MSAEALSRIRWNDAELETVAAQMQALREQDPHLGDLEAVRRAQAVLPASRQRDIKTWALLAARLRPKLDALKSVSVPAAAHEESPSSKIGEESGPTAPPTTSVTTCAADAVESVAEPLAALDAAQTLADHGTSAPHSAEAALAAPASGGTLMVEASLIAALQSPAVERALVDVFTRSMAQAFARLSERDTHEPPSEPQRVETRVLLAGFASPQAKALAEAINGLCEVRLWKPAQGPQLFETLAGICSVAVLPEEAEDEVVSDLRQRNLVVIRHGGSTTKLVERLESVLRN